MNFHECRSTLGLSRLSSEESAISLYEARDEMHYLWRTVVATRSFQLVFRQSFFAAAEDERVHVNNRF